MFLKNMSPPSSEVKRKPSKKPAWSRQFSECRRLHSGFLLALLFNSEGTTRRYIPDDELFITTTVRISNPTNFWLPTLEKNPVVPISSSLSSYTDQAVQPVLVPNVMLETSFYTSHSYSTNICAFTRNTGQDMAQLTVCSVSKLSAPLLRIILSSVKNLKLMLLFGYL
jgi:hypothetical protein